MVVISITNMHCGGCAKGVRATVEKIVPGSSLKIDLERRHIQVDAPDTDAVMAALRADGWDALLVAS